MIDFFRRKIWFTDTVRYISNEKYYFIVHRVWSINDTKTQFPPYNVRRRQVQNVRNNVRFVRIKNGGEKKKYSSDDCDFGTRFGYSSPTSASRTAQRKHKIISR